MEEIEDFADERNKSWCIHCGAWLTQVATNEDHVPSKSILRKPRPHHLPIVRVCSSCNSSFSKDEQYFVAFIQSVLIGSSDPSKHANPSASRALSESPKLRERIERSKTIYRTHGGDTRIVWKPEVDRINRVILKNARGHAYFEFGEPMLDEPDHVWNSPLEALTPAERRTFEEASDTDHLAVWPEVGSRMMTRVATGLDLDGPWVIVQDGTYRYLVAQRSGIVVRSVLYEYLATEVQWS
jgi:hypothetical protein